MGTHADSIGFNHSHGSKSNGSNGGSSSLSNANNEHNFGASSSHQNGLSEVTLDNWPVLWGPSFELWLNFLFLLIFKADRKRAHHNALERKRRDHIKDSFHTLRDAIPNIKGEKVSVSIRSFSFKMTLTKCSFVSWLFYRHLEHKY